MPWFHRKPDDDQRQDVDLRQRQIQAANDQKASIDALERGGIPVQAQRRLDDIRAQETSFFTSDLTVNEFLLTRSAGYRPITQVMGSSIYHVGWQRMPQVWGSSRELEVVSQAFNHSRERAMARLAEEAQRVGANAVVGVRITRGRYDWGRDLVEFIAIGTAVKVDGAPQSARTGVTSLSGQDFWKLCQAGYWPVGVAGASTVYYIVAGWRTQFANSGWGTGWFNQELVDFTQGLYTARHLAMNRAYQQAAALGGSGMVGMDIEQSAEEHDVKLGNDQERTDLVVTFHVIGTVIAEDANGPRVPEMRYVVNIGE